MSNFLITDSDLGIDAQAWAVFYALKARFLEMPERFWCEPRAWYNGRENGIVVSVYTAGRHQQLNVVFCEHRNSDNIVVDIWESEGGMNPPTYNDKGYEESYQNRKSFDYLDIRSVCGYIINRISTFCFEAKDCFEAKEKERIG